MKSKCSSPINSAVDGHPTPHGFYDSLCECQTKAGSMDLSIANPRTPVERIPDQLQFGLIDSDTVVNHADGHFLALAKRGGTH